MDLNRADLKSLAEVVGVPAAYDLVLWRPYMTWEDVGKVPGIDAARVRALRAAGAVIKPFDRLRWPWGSAVYLFLAWSVLGFEAIDDLDSAVSLIF